MSIQYFGTKMQMHQQRVQLDKEQIIKPKGVSMRYVKRFLIYASFLSTIVSASCLIYIVQWLEALRKGWLV
jgi:hypothetical protein